mmetsp:Transcript_32104/g.70258  ORF Transcript_32104/g.70258 Transcript_32104/m.70258 type:complete len:220 (-) Transcript_32104:1241-1900(-)
MHLTPLYATRKRLGSIASSIAGFSSRSPLRRLFCSSSSHCCTRIFTMLCKRCCFSSTDKRQAWRKCLSRPQHLMKSANRLLVTFQQMQLPSSPRGGSATTLRLSKVNVYGMLCVACSNVRLNKAPSMRCSCPQHSETRKWKRVWPVHVRSLGVRVRAEIFSKSQRMVTKSLPAGSSSVSSLVNIPRFGRVNSTLPFQPSSSLETSSTPAPQRSSAEYWS